MIRFKKRTNSNKIVRRNLIIFNTKGQLINDQKVINIVDVLVTKRLSIVKLDPNYRTNIYRHIACFLHGSQGGMKKVTTGENSQREAWKGCKYGTHAEVDALNHLPPPQELKAYKKTINLIVIRIDLNGNLKNSKPCFKCIEYLRKIRGYKLRYVYYSDDNGNILMEKFNDLLNSENKHVSRRFRTKIKLSI